MRVHAHALCRSIAVLSLLAPAASAGGPCSGSCTPKSGTINGEVWTVSDSPICVTSDLTVLFLIIEPGVCVLVDDCEFDVDGTLIANGTESDPITFTALNASDRWRGIRFEDTPATPGSSLQHCTVELADSSGIEIINSHPSISDCTIRNNTTDGSGGGINAVLNAGDLVLTNCRIVGNTASSTPHGHPDCPFPCGLSSGQGGGISFSAPGASKLELVGCDVSENFLNDTDPCNCVNVDFCGGGVYADGNLEMRKTIVAKNNCYAGGSASDALGGGVYCTGGYLIVENCTITENACVTVQTPSGTARGGGMHVDCSGESVTISTSFIGCNTTCASAGDSHGTGIYVARGNVEIRNVTCVRNHVSDGFVCAPDVGEGIYVAAHATLIDSSIVYFNDDAGTQIGGGGAITVQYSDVQGGFAGTGNLSVNPGLMGPACDCNDMFVPPLPAPFLPPTVDMGNPAGPDDVCFPPSQGGARNDMGAHGGPLACNWCDGSAQVVRLGTPPNPNVFLPGQTSGPVLGATWDPVIDHTTFVVNAISDFVIVTDGADNLDLGATGTLLCDLFTAPALHTGGAAPGDAFSIGVPDNCALVGVSLCAQGGSIDMVFAAHLTNALDVVIGSF